MTGNRTIPTAARRLLAVWSARLGDTRRLGIWRQLDERAWRRLRAGDLAAAYRLRSAADVLLRPTDGQALAECRKAGRR